MSEESSNISEPMNKAIEDVAIKPIASLPNGKPKSKSVGREVLEWVISLLVAIALAFVIRMFLFEPIRVDGSSMLSTLHDNEFMIVTKPEYIFGAPSRFDVVILHYPGRFDKFGRMENFVKRVVGIPGDVVAMKDGYLYVNGEKYEEEYLDDANRPNYEGEWTVGEGEYFVLGDNRSNSNDSHIIGPVKREMITGHVRLVLFPFNAVRVVK